MGQRCARWHRSSDRGVFTGTTFAAQSVGAVLAGRSVAAASTGAIPLRSFATAAISSTTRIAHRRPDRHVCFAVGTDSIRGHGPSYFTRTTDGGLTREAARPIYDPGLDRQTINQIVVLPMERW
jgi:hypothetical protein